MERARKKPSRLGGVALLALAVTTAVPTSCGGRAEDCGTVNCEEGAVFVAWLGGQLQGSAYRLCVDGSCDLPTSARPAIVDRVGGFDVVSMQRAGDRVVRLDVLDDAGAVIRSLEGVGRESGGCCSAVHLRVDEEGTALEDR